MKCYCFFVVTSLAILGATSYIIRTRFQIEHEKNPEFWREKSKTERLRIMKNHMNIKKAKNAILFLGDGMTTTTVTAGRILKGQLEGKEGEASKLAMDTMPYSGFSKTYTTDSQVADSAATATAYLSGVKTNNGMLGINAYQPRSLCKGSVGKEVESFIIKGNKQGKSSGVVTTTHIAHATPGGSYAHVSERNWYSDKQLSDEAKREGCEDISAQLIKQSKHLDVIMGGGQRYMYPNKTNPEKYERLDSRNLVDEWKQQRKAENKNSFYVTNKTELYKIQAKTTDSLFGLFANKHLSYDYYRKNDPQNDEPSLADMTRKAIEILQKNENGFVLLVEGGRIDHAHHAGQAKLALHDLVAFDDAIQVAKSMTSSEDTLIVITADHGHTMAMGGYSVRGNDILGLAPSQNEPEVALDGKPFTTILYANGPGYTLNTDPQAGECAHDRETLDKDTVIADGYHQQAAVPLASETHGGEDVGVYSSGPFSHLLTGVFEQSYIAHIIMYATCIHDDQHPGCVESPELITVLGKEVTLSYVSGVMKLLIVLTCVFGAAFLVLLILFYTKLKRTSDSPLTSASISMEEK